MEENIYHLRILYPSSNKWNSSQYYDETIVAGGVEHENGSMLFYDGSGVLVAAYPSNYTIIVSIE